MYCRKTVETRPNKTMRFSSRCYDAIVIGSGPNGLAAAITLAQAGCSVLVCEGQPTLGGGMRSAELTLPGFTHDLCSAVHPLALASPFFQTLPLAEHGLEWIQPPVPLAHPLDDGTAVVVERSVDLTGGNLGRDSTRYIRLMSRLVRDWNRLERTLLGPPRFPRYPFTLARFGLYAMRSAVALAKTLFNDERARAMFAGMAAHSVLPLESRPSAAFGLVLSVTAHLFGWPFARGGSQRIADALVSYLRSLGGEILTGAPVDRLEQLPPARVILCDVTPRQLHRIAADRLPGRFQRKLQRYRYGPGIFKLDWALDGPIPWKAERCRDAGTIHLGGTFEEIAASERAPWQDQQPEKPFVLLAQPSLFDPTRAPGDKHTAWAYCHVPNGSSFDMTERIEMQIERFAPGFRNRILMRHAMPATQLELHNPNLVGGDITGGAADLRQLLFRPTRRTYATPLKTLYICSSSTPPGGGVHGMCGHQAARMALQRGF